MKNVLIWVGALVLGAILGLLGVGWLDVLMNFVASAFTRLFQFVAVPTIALAVITTLMQLGGNKGVGRLFAHTLVYTLLTTIVAAAVGLVLYRVIQPGNLPVELVSQGQEEVPQGLSGLSYFDHILSVIPNNVITPFATGNVLSILLVSVAVGFTLSYLRKNQPTPAIETLVQGILGLQELLFALIKGLIKVLPLGIVAFAAQLSSQVSAGVVADSLGLYTLVIVGANLLQMFVVLPLFLLARGLNPVKVFRAMTPAVLMALFTKSSAATLPVTIRSAEERLKAKPTVARFVLPICCTINMNGCATFILVTSLFILQNGGMELTLGTMLLWLCIAVISAVGNAGVPMGCYFLTLSLMAGTQSPALGIMGIILPIFTIIDMIETAENVWSDSCVCAMVNPKEEVAPSE
jgi:Na+/H+-dicarboxylate symporter